MPAPITLQLSKFEQIEILRAEIEKREEELKQIERQMREVLFELERQRYLQTVHAMFHEMPQPEQATNMPHYAVAHDTLSEAIEAMHATLTRLQSETAGQTAPPSRSAQQARPGMAAPSAPAVRRKFDSFDDFKSNKQGG